MGAAILGLLGRHALPIGIAAAILLSAAVFLPAELAVPAGIMVIVSQAWLGWNLWSGVRVFCDHRDRIVKKSAVS